MCLRRIDYIDKFADMCDNIQKEYPRISFSAFTEKYCKEFDETEIGTYDELADKRHKLIDNLKPKFGSYNQERERRLKNAKVWLKRIMFEDSVDKFSNDTIVQNKVCEYLYNKANAESETIAECWNNLDKYNTIISDILKLLKER